MRQANSAEVAKSLALEGGERERERARVRNGEGGGRPNDWG